MNKTQAKALKREMLEVGEQWGAEVGSWLVELSDAGEGPYTTKNPYNDDQKEINEIMTKYNCDGQEIMDVYRSIKRWRKDPETIRNEEQKWLEKCRRETKKYE